MDITRESSERKFNPIVKAGKLLIKKSSGPTFYINFKTQPGRAFPEIENLRGS